MATVKNTKKKRKKKKSSVVPALGHAFVKASYNNTVLTLTDQSGNTISWASAGKMGFRGPKKSTAYAASVIAKDAVTLAMEKGLKEVHVFVKGVGSGREAAIRALNSHGLIIVSIKDITPVPHNGCRAPKPRRV